MFIISIFAVIWTICVKLTGKAELGWSSTVCSIWFIGGLQILALGIIGEYVGRIYEEVKQRPRFIIEEFINESEDMEKLSQSSKRL